MSLKEEFAERGWQCTLCANFFPEGQEHPAKCPRCGCERFRQISEFSPRDLVADEAVQHLQRTVTKCFNYTVGARSEKIFHDLKLVQRIDITRANAPAGKGKVVINQICENCGLLYHQNIVPMSRLDVLEKLPKELFAQVKPFLKQ